MKTFTLDPNGFKKVWTKTLRFVLPFMLMALSFPWILSAFSDRPSPGDTTPILIVLFLGVLAFSLFRSMKRQKQLWETYELIMDGDTITRKQDNVPTITLNRSEIVEITETAQGHLLLKTKARTNFINIPHDVQERDALIGLLSAFGTITKQTRNSVSIWTIVTPILTLVLMVVFFTATDKKITLLSGTILIIGLVWGFIEIQRSKHIDKRIKRNSYVVFVLLLSIVAGMISAFNA